MDELINRARTLIAVLRTDEAIDHLVDEGVPYLDAFLAVKAAEIAERARSL
jgi:hypothetical protein